MVASAFGSVAYAMGLGLSELMEKEHPWFRLSVAEGPGCTGSTYNLLTKPEEWGQRIICTCVIDYWMAPKAKGPYEKAVPDIADKVKMLGNYYIATVGLYTLDPNIKTEKDLAGKTVALGKRGQTAWGLLPTMVLTELAPELNCKLDYLDPKSATAALIDGRADAACISLVVSPDFAVVRKTGAMIDMEASGRTPHWIAWSDDLVKRAEDTGWLPYLNPVVVAAGTYPNQTEPLQTTFIHCGLSCGKDSLMSWPTSSPNSGSNTVLP